MFAHVRVLFWCRHLLGSQIHCQVFVLRKQILRAYRQLEAMPWPATDEPKKGETRPILQSLPENIMFVYNFMSETCYSRLSM